MRKIGVVAVSSIMALAADRANAQEWLDGNFGFVSGLACVTYTPETEVTTYAGYWGKTDASFPQTGDVTYVRGAGAMVGNTCAGYEVMSFDFQLPAGASFAISNENPVWCLATRLSDGYITTTDPNIHCAQSPAVGPMGGWNFGYAKVAHGWLYETRVPVLLDRALYGIGGPASDNLKVGTFTADGSLIVEAWVTAPYRALVNYPAPSSAFLGTDTQGNDNYRLTGYIYNFFQSGTAYVDAGVSSGSYSPVASGSLPDTAENFIVGTDLNVTPGYYYYWRMRFENSNGTFVGPEQVFFANGASPVIYALSVSKAGAGAGTVASDPQGLSCGATCAVDFTDGSVVTLTAQPDPSSEFSGWSGDCTGTGACTVTMSQARDVTATFGVAPVPTMGTLDVSVSGLPNGASGVVSVTGPGGYNRTFTMQSGLATSVSDVAVGEYIGTVADVAVGPDSYMGRPATIVAGVVGGGRGVIAANYQVGRQLTVTRSGAGSGSITSSPGGLDCGSVCNALFADGETVTLNPSPDPGSVFLGWSACAGSGACDVTMNFPQQVDGTFDLAAPGTITLSVVRYGNGFGTVTSNLQPGIDCGTVCNFNFDADTSVSLTHSEATGSVFSGWGPPCSGTGDCYFRLGEATTLTAAFNLEGSPYALAASAANGAANRTAAKGQERVPMLGFELSSGMPGLLTAVTVQASGSGNDAADLTNVELFIDANANGQIDVGEDPIAAGTFAANNGSLELNLTGPRDLLAGATHLIVTADLNTTLAAGSLVLPRLPWSGVMGLALALLFAAALVVVRRRVAWGATGVALILAACGGDSSPSKHGNSPTAHTYQLSLTAVSAYSGSQTAVLSGLPVNGASVGVAP